MIVTGPKLEIWNRMVQKMRLTSFGKLDGRCRLGVGMHTFPGLTVPGKGSKNGNGAENAATAVDWIGVLLLLNGMEGTDTLD